jgi:hypothetical protein
VKNARISQKIFLPPGCAIDVKYNCNVSVKQDIFAQFVCKPVGLDAPELAKFGNKHFHPGNTESCIGYKMLL